MSIAGTIRVRCAACGVEHDAKLIQSINTRTDKGMKERLLAGELNVLVCECGKRTQLAATVVFHDPDADFMCQVCPGGEAAMEKGAEAFRISGAMGTRRLVPSLNALIEKVKLVDARLEDWAIEMAKVLLLASIDVRDLDRVLLFDQLDGQTIDWVLFDEHGRAPHAVSSPLAAYEKLVTRTQSKPTASELRIDRAWATLALQAMIASAN